jgi:hypothetical protein
MVAWTSATPMPLPELPYHRTATRLAWTNAAIEARLRSRGGRLPVDAEHLHLDGGHVVLCPDAIEGTHAAEPETRPH